MTTASSRPKSLGSWLRRHSLTLVAALGGAAGVAYAANYHQPAPPAPRALVQLHTNTHTTTTPQPAGELPRDTAKDTVQIALLLDTSSSMDGLINQARAHLWNMVDQMGRMTRVVNGKTRGVKIELALYEYGNDTIPASAGHIRQVQGFTTDLDKVSEKLHALFTNGGEEYVGQAIETSVAQLPWSTDKDAMRFVFVAGNERFDQGPVTAQKAMQAAAAKDVHVQLIRCGHDSSGWAEAAKLAQSDLMSIDQNHVAQYIPAPQDADILRLNSELNATYLAYGSEGEAGVARQAQADAASGKMSPKVALERAQMKSKKRAYSNENWDLVDALDKNADFLAQAKDGDLPADMRGKTLDEKKAIVAKHAARRAEIQAQIAKLEAERTKFLQVEEQKRGEANAPSLQSELMKGTKKFATKKGYKL